MLSSCSTNQKMALYLSAALMGLNLQPSIKTVSCLKLSRGGVIPKHNLLYRQHPQMIEAIRWNFELRKSHADGKVLPFIFASTDKSEMVGQVSKKTINMNTQDEVNKQKGEISIEEMREKLNLDVKKKRGKSDAAARNNLYRFEEALTFYAAQREIEAKEHARAKTIKAGGAHGKETQGNHVGDHASDTENRNPYDASRVSALAKIRAAQYETKSSNQYHHPGHSDVGSANPDECGRTRSVSYARANPDEGDKGKAPSQYKKGTYITIGGMRIMV